MVKKKELTVAELISKEKATIKKHKLSTRTGQVRKAVLKLIDDKAPAKSTAPQNWDPKVWADMRRKPLKEKLIVASALIALEIDMLAEE